MIGSVKSKPTVSIVSICYNQADYIRQTLESFVTQQTTFDFEIVIFDDCSQDEAPAIIREYAAKYPKLFRPLLRTKNVGVQPNLVEALQAAQGKYVALCEGDDYWTDPHKLQKQVDFLDSHPECALCFHRVKVFTEGDPGKELIFPGLDDKSGFTVGALMERNFIQTNSVMYRRQDYSHIPDDVMPFDWYLHAYHASFGEIGFIDAVMSAYRRHPGGIWWNSDRDIDKIWIKHGLSHISLYEEMLKLHGSDPRSKAATIRLILGMFNNLIKVDQTHHHGLVGKAIRRFPVSTELVVLEQARLLEARENTQAAQVHQSPVQGVRGASKELLRALKSSLRARLRP